MNTSVRFTGRIPPEEVYRYYALGDLFVSASTFELHNMSYLEAMACGLPLVCREDKSLHGVLEQGINGLDEPEYVRAVKLILEDSILRANMRENAIKKVQEFSDEQFARRTLALYTSVCERQAATTARLQTRSAENTPLTDTHSL